MFSSAEMFFNINLKVMKKKLVSDTRLFPTDHLTVSSSFSAHFIINITYQRNYCELASVAQSVPLSIHGADRHSPLTAVHVLPFFLLVGQKQNIHVWQYKDLRPDRQVDETAAGQLLEIMRIRME